ncbi:MAG: hypothetical protein ACLPP2_05640 [Thermoplasmata archaeon]
MRVSVAPYEPEIAAAESPGPELAVEESPRPAPPQPAPIAHVSPPPTTEVRPPAPTAPFSTVGSQPEDPIADATTTDLLHWIQQPSSWSLELRRKMRDELARREPVAEEEWERDAIRWLLAAYGRI